MKHEFRQNKTYRYVVCTFLILVAVMLIFQFRYLNHLYEYGWLGSQDFIEYWSAGQLLMTGANPYDFDALYALQQTVGYSNADPMIMWNPPWLLVWIFPIFFLPFAEAAVSWLIVSLVLVLFSGILVWRTLSPKGLQEKVMIPVIATITFLPLLFALALGQMSTLIVLGLAGFMYFMKNHRPFLAGLFLSLTMVKPHIVYLLWIAVVFWIITQRDWRLTSGICVMMISSVAVLWIVLPDWLSFYYGALKTPPLYWTTPTAGTYLRLVFFKNWTQAHFLPTIVTGLLFAGYLVNKRPMLKWENAVPPLLLVSLPTAAYGWSFDQIILLIPYLYIVTKIFGDELRTHGNYRWLLVLGLVIIELGILMQRMYTIDINHWFYEYMKLHYSDGLRRYLRISHEAFYFWVPCALSIVYLLAYSRNKRSSLS
jgi:hypothetical protein